MERSEHAKELFLSGHNCAQSVVLAFADDLKFSKELGLKMAAGFGAGMGRQQETCGAVTGAIMILGLFEGEKVNNNDELKTQAYGSVQDLTSNFIDEFQTTRCRDLIGCDLNTPEGSARFDEENKKETVCARCVQKAVTIVESISNQNA